MIANTATGGATRLRPIGFTSFLSAATQALVRARSTRRTAKALADLDDYLLVDIGLNPAEYRRSRHTVSDWVLQSNGGTARLVFIGR